MKEIKRVKCIDDIHMSYLRNGKEYKVFEEEAGLYLIEIEDGQKLRYFKTRFEDIDAPKNESVRVVANYKIFPYISKIESCVGNGKPEISYHEEEEIHFKVIVNNKTTIVILEDGSKGVAKCSPEDTFNTVKGYDIASKRAIIKSFQKELKQLCQ